MIRTLAIIAAVFAASVAMIFAIPTGSAPVMAQKAKTNTPTPTKTNTPAPTNTPTNTLVPTNTPTPIPGTCTYYVSTSGSNSNDGTSLSTPFLTIQKAADTASAGETVCIRGGRYDEEVMFWRSGTSGSPITFQRYQSERVVVYGGRNETSWAQLSGTNVWQKTIQRRAPTIVQGVDHQTVSLNSCGFGAIGGNYADAGILIGNPNLDNEALWNQDTWLLPACGVQPSNLAAGMWLSDGYSGGTGSNATVYIRLQDNGNPNNTTVHITDRGDAINFWHGPSWVTIRGLDLAMAHRGATGDVNHVVFDGLNVFLMAEYGFHMNQGANNEIKNSRFHHNAEHQLQWEPDSTDIHHNELFIGGLVPPGWSPVGNCGLNLVGNGNTIRDNVVYDNYGPGLCLEQWYCASCPFNNSASNNLIYRNRIHSNGMGIAIGGSDGTLVYNNLIYNISDRAIEVLRGLTGDGTRDNDPTLPEDQKAKNNKIYNNTIYDGDVYGIVIDFAPWAVNTAVQNNLFYLVNADIDDRTSGTSGTVISNNLMDTDPLFTNAGAGDFHIGASSPARNIGTNLYSVGVTTDYDLCARPSTGNFDVGAYQYACAGGPTATPTPTHTPAVATNTPTPTPTPTPDPEITITFNDAGVEEDQLNGEYPTDVVNWGTDLFYVSAAWEGFSTRSMTLNFQNPTVVSAQEATFTLETPRLFKRLDVQNTDGSSQTVNLTCGSQTKQINLTSFEVQTSVATGWTSTCTSVTVAVTASSIENIQFDNFVVQ